jgi:hypothetical protein
MSFAHVLVDSIDSALEDSKHAFDCVCVGISSYILFGRMIDGAVRRELFADSPIDPAFIGSEMGLQRSDGNDQRPNGLSRDIRDME